MKTQLLITILITLFVKTTNAQSIHDLEWMSGLWIGNQNGVMMEEYWTEPAGGTLIGLHRDTFSESSSFFEFLRIEETKEGLIYFAQPKGGKATEFRTSELEINKVTFSNPNHDFPQHLHYHLIHPDTIKVGISGLDEGELKQIEWKWVRSTINYGDK
ncbi:MAG: DUF6265 family protein [bacterium]|nr:DUF6265 family protein [bacterium]